MIASSTLGFFSSDELYVDSQHAILCKPLESCSAAVTLSYDFLKSFDEFFAISSALSHCRQREVQVRIDFTRCSNNDQYCKILVSHAGRTNTISKPLLEYFKNTLLRHSQSIYFPLFTLSKFVLQSVESVYEEDAPAHNLLISYFDDEIKSAFGLVESNKRCDVIPLYYSGFLNALKNQEDWELVDGAFAAQTEILSAISADLEFAPCVDNGPVVCQKVYYPQECKVDTSSIASSTITAAPITKAVLQTRSIPTIATLCETFADLGENFLWRDYQHRGLTRFDELCYSLNDLEEVAYVSTGARSPSVSKGTTLRLVLFHHHMYPLFASKSRKKVSC